MDKLTNGDCEGGDLPDSVSNFCQSLKPDPELDNFLKCADEICYVVKGLASSDPRENERALRQADILLHQKNLNDIPDADNVQCKVTKSRSVINKIEDDNKGASGDGEMSQEGFMRMVEKDAKERAADRKKRKKESDELRKKGNFCFGKKDYTGALYNYNEAIKLIKDSPCLYNNRALTYLRLGIYSSAIADCDIALELETFSFRARMYKAKALFLSGEAEKCKAELEIAKERLPGHVDMINDYEKEIFNMGREEPEDVLTSQEQKWRDAARGVFNTKNDSKPDSSND